MRFLTNYLPDPGAGWFGFALRAQDFMNFEVVWFIPRSRRGFTVAYVPVAHGIVPWWTEAYETQEKGTMPLPQNDWFKARADVKDIESGRPGFFVGTATDAAFRRVSVRAI